jgi:hypothetical protein
MAMARLVQEFSAAPPLAVGSGDRSPGAELVRQVVIDPSQAARTLAGSSSWRSDPKELAASILQAAPENGFSVSAAALSPAEWQALHAELIKITQRPE